MQRQNIIAPYIPDETRYEKMQYRAVGKSGLKMSAISLGLWQNFGGYDNYENCRAIVRHAFDLGITVFDLANNYGPPIGAAEETMGRLMEEDMRPYRDEMLITTKAGYTMWPGPYGDWGSRKYLLASLDQSLKRMGLDYVDIFYHHRMDPNTPLEETMGALATAVKSGKALYVGISNYSPEMAEKAVKILAGMGVHCLICQSRYNMLDRGVERLGLFKTAEKSGFGMTAFSPLAQGRLTGKYNHGIPEGSRASGKSFFLNKDGITPELVNQVSKLGEIAKKRGQTMAQMALSWVLREKTMASVLIGASSPEQLDENAKCLQNLDFTSDELKAIDAIVG
ncbi:MAG TPA: aldo/keto reductase [Caproicibacter sp.]|nr:aldo/keto reductase [Caproicibacter sp.]